jgi:hypothetical protein
MGFGFIRASRSAPDRVFTAQIGPRGQSRPRQADIDSALIRPG